MSRAKLIEPGTRFGMLTVLSQHARHHAGITWLCRCDCGGTSTPRGDRLRSGETASCGCQSHRKAPDLSGHRFGRLQVVCRAGSMLNGEAAWSCRCDCGAEVVVGTAHLTHGDTKSCGCLLHQTVHGMARKGCQHALYKTWSRIKQRCGNPNNKHYKNYGGRGITVCERWMSFQSFYDDVSPSYAEGLTLDRIDNNKGYAPDNFRWATRKVQQNNRRTRAEIAADDIAQGLTPKVYVKRVRRLPG